MEGTGGIVYRFALVAIVAILGIVGGAGCAEVKPYQRAQLAHPTMAADDPYTSPLAAHVNGVSEGPAGGLSGGGGGCGCN